MSLIRPSQDADLPQITAIYAHHVLHGTGTFETSPPTESDMTARRADVLGKGLPYLVIADGQRVLGFAYCQWFKPRPAYRFSAEDSIYMHPDAARKGLPYLVIEDGGRVVGFAYCQWFKPRPAYRFSAEDSIYMHPDAAGQGLGRQLLSDLVRQAQAVGIRKLIAVIGDSGNAGSVGVHKALGFTHAGTIKACGWKFDRWLDIVLMEKAVGEGDSAPPRAGT